MGASIDDIACCECDSGGTNKGQQRSSTIMRIRNVIAPLLVAGASAVAIAVAPLANAAPTGPVCTSTGANSTLCQSNGNAQVSATPPAVNYQAQYPFFGPYGLLFHHGGHHR
jgi:hypothetical protein